MIQVVNKRHYHGEGVNIGRPSVLGNPFSHLEKSLAQHRVGSRQEAIERYEEWFDAQEEKSAVKQEFRRLVEKYRAEGSLVLICHCAPLSCHGHVLSKKIQEAIENKEGP